jgi:hypothetical protein
MVQEDKERLAVEKDSPGSEALFSPIQSYINSFKACNAMKCADELQEYWQTFRENISKGGLGAGIQRISNPCQTRAYLSNPSNPSNPYPDPSEPLPLGAGTGLLG